MYKFLAVPLRARDAASSYTGGGSPGGGPPPRPVQGCGASARPRVRGKDRRERGGVLAFAGETGTGKTYVAVGALREVTDAGLRGAFVASAEFCDDLRERGYNVADVRRYAAGLRRYEFVVLDDFGSERVRRAEAGCWTTTRAF